MRKSRYTAEQIALTLRQGEARAPVQEIYRKMGVPEATHFRCKKKYVGFGVTELTELRQVLDENRKLKGIVADLTLDRTILQPAASSPDAFSPTTTSSSLQAPSTTS